MSAEEKLDEIVKVTKKNFDPRERLRRRGLRRATLTLFTDEEVGEVLGRDYPIENQVGMVVGHDRAGVLGDLAELAEKRERLDSGFNADEATAADKKKHAARLKEIDADIEALEARRDELIEELTKTSITMKLRAVPPVIQKDCHRLAKQTMGIETKGVPEDMAEEVRDAELAHMLAAMVESLTDNESGLTNDVFDYGDAVAHREELPPSQWARIDMKVGELQFTDAISRTIEGQEDFS